MSGDGHRLRCPSCLDRALGPWGFARERERGARMDASACASAGCRAGRAGRPESRATEAAERIGETATTCSFHLRQLAKYGFVEEAGGGRGRQRPWRLVRLGVRIPPLRDSAEWTAAAEELERVMVARYLERFEHWMRFRHGYPEEWRSAAASSERILFLTLQEFKAFGAEVRSLLDRHAERVVDPGRRPPDSVAVEALFFAYPVGGPGGE